MKRFMRSALLGTAGLVAFSLPANALGPTTIADTPQFVSKTTQLARDYRRSYTDDGYGRIRDTAAGSVGFKKAKKKSATVK